MDNELMTGKEVQAFLKISRAALHKWVKAGRLSSYKIGPRAVRFKRAEVEALLQRDEGR